MLSLNSSEVLAKLETAVSNRASRAATVSLFSPIFSRISLKFNAERKDLDTSTAKAATAATLIGSAITAGIPRTSLSIGGWITLIRITEKQPHSSVLDRQIYPFRLNLFEL